MEFLDLVKARYTCRKFSEKKVEKQKLDYVLEAGRLAPTAKNSQPQKIVVISSKEGLNKVDEVSPCRYGAPIVIAVGYDADNQYTYPEGKCTSGVEDATIVGTHMVLASVAVGLNSCIINCFEQEKAAKLFGCKQNEKLVMLIALGYGDGFEPTPNHFSRKELKETVREI